MLNSLSPLLRSIVYSVLIGFGGGADCFSDIHFVLSSYKEILGAVCRQPLGSRNCDLDNQVDS